MKMWELKSNMTIVENRHLVSALDRSVNHILAQKNS